MRLARHGHCAGGLARRAAATLAALALAAPAAAQQADLEAGLAGALKACEEWVLNPASHVAGPKPFVAAVDLDDRMVLVAEVPEASLPPPQLRVANWYWRIDAAGGGYFLVVSDRLPVCHITGGGDADLQPAVEAVLASSAFGSRWERVTATDETRGEMASTELRYREEPRFTMVISRANAPGLRRDRVQVLATAILDTSS